MRYFTIGETSNRLAALRMEKYSISSSRITCADR